jgi:hypothetical protein
MHYKVIITIIIITTTTTTTTTTMMMMIIIILIYKKGIMGLPEKDGGNGTHAPMHGSKLPDT